MVPDDFVERPVEYAAAQGGRRSSGPTTLDAERPAPTTNMAASETTLEELRGLGLGQPLSTRPTTVSPWKEVALAKQRPGYFLAKRVLDCTLALLGLLLAAPILLLAWVLVRLSSPGPAIFRQERMGFRGRRFVLYKFRSMYVTHDESLQLVAYERFIRGEQLSGKVETPPPAAGGQAPRQRSGAPRDPRVTPLGHLLRRSSIDELPQLVNVLRGEMSLVGPRPPIPCEVDLYQAWHLGRLETLPGITGLWQVQGRSRVSFDRMVHMDLEYIARQSFWYDVKVLLFTIPAVLSRKGAY